MEKVLCCFVFMIIMQVNGQWGPLNNGFGNFGMFHGSYFTPPPFQSSWEKPFTFSPFSKFSTGPLFPQKMFPPFHHFSMPHSFHEKMKSLRISQMKRHMLNGIGGVTLLSSTDRVVLKKDGETYECLGNYIPYQFYCQGSLRKFEISDPRDYCYSDQYFQDGSMLCIANTGQRGISFTNNNGHYSCYGSDNKPGLILSVQDYQNMCGRLPQDNVYSYYPNMQHPLHVQLPNPELGCMRNQADVCVFKLGPGFNFNI